MGEVMEELREMERERHERLAETMPDVYVCPGVYYHTQGLGQLNERVHVDPDAPDNDPVIILDADYVKMAALDEVIGTIVHEVIHNVLEQEHGYIASHKYDWISDWVEFWTPPDRSDWHEKLLGGKRRPTCPDCKHVAPLPDDYRGKGEYKTVACHHGIKSALDTYARGCEKFEPREDARDEIILDPDIHETGEGLKALLFFVTRNESRFLQSSFVMHNKIGKRTNRQRRGVAAHVDNSGTVSFKLRLFVIQIQYLYIQTGEGESDHAGDNSGPRQIRGHYSRFVVTISNASFCSTIRQIFVGGG